MILSIHNDNCSILFKVRFDISKFIIRINSFLEGLPTLWASIREAYNLDAKLLR